MRCAGLWLWLWSHLVVVLVVGGEYYSQCWLVAGVCTTPGYWHSTEGGTERERDGLSVPRSLRPGHAGTPRGRQCHSVTAPHSVLAWALPHHLVICPHSPHSPHCPHSTHSIHSPHSTHSPHQNTTSYILLQSTTDLQQYIANTWEIKRILLATKAGLGVTQGRDGGISL